MKVEEFERFARFVQHPMVVVSSDGVVLAANPAATRLSDVISPGRCLYEAAADRSVLEQRLRRWLRVGGPIPTRLPFDLTENDRDEDRQWVRANVGRVSLADGPALLISIGDDGRDRLAQVTEQLRASRRESRHRREIDDLQQARLAAEQNARQQLQRVQALTSALAATATVNETAEAILAHTPSVVGASAVIALADNPDGPRLLATDAAPLGLSAEAGELADVPQPLAAALAGSDTVFFDTPKDLLSTYPALADTTGSVQECGYLTAALPLRTDADADAPPTAALGFVAVNEQGLSPEQQVAAQVVATQSAQALERARLFDAQRHFAEALQKALLPTRFPHSEGVECAVRYLPAKTLHAVGGDWYAVIALGNGRTGLAVGDVAGHGLGAATTMGTMRNALRALATAIDQPADVLDAFNRFVCAQLAEVMASCVYLVIDVHAGTLTYANAGHPPPLHIIRASGPEYLQDVLQPPLGVSPDTSHQQARARLDDRSHLVLYTDGLIERRGESIDLGLNRLLRASITGKPDPNELSDHLLATLIGDETLDDDTALLVATIDRHH